MIRTLVNCPAPAKLNLFLHVTGRRPDGYHLLQTVFQLLDYGDMLHFSTREDDFIHRTTDVPGVPENTDLIVRAARLLQSAARSKDDHRPLGADIAIDKHLPMGGGLGGGSSDAATTLIVLNHLWQTGFNCHELMDMGLQLGADVPFFLFGQNAFAEGIGEALQTVNTPAYWYVVIHPGISVPTAAIFSSPELTRNSKPVRIADFPEAAIGFGENDLQAVATKLFPPIEQAINWLNSYGEARMTGSGACVFCAFKEEHNADEVLEKARQSGQANWSVWKAKAIERHPLSHLVRS
jgi:4-diphosphocytidyl-2-C-methyl-D-erythritol kinase